MDHRRSKWVVETSTRGTQVGSSRTSEGVCSVIGVLGAMFAPNEGRMAGTLCLKALLLSALTKSRKCHGAERGDLSVSVDTYDGPKILTFTGLEGTNFHRGVCECAYDQY